MFRAQDMAELCLAHHQVDRQHGRKDPLDRFDNSYGIVCGCGTNILRMKKKCLGCT